jgi:hypothetical protein
MMCADRAIVRIENKSLMSGYLSFGVHLAGSVPLRGNEEVFWMLSGRSARSHKGSRRGR